MAGTTKRAPPAAVTKKEQSLLSEETLRRRAHHRRQRLRLTFAVLMLYITGRGIMDLRVLHFHYPTAPGYAAWSEWRRFTSLAFDLICTFSAFGLISWLLAYLRWPEVRADGTELRLLGPSSSSPSSYGLSETGADPSAISSRTLRRVMRMALLSVYFLWSNDIRPLLDAVMSWMIFTVPPNQHRAALMTAVTRTGTMIAGYYVVGMSAWMIVDVIHPLRDDAVMKSV